MKLSYAFAALALLAAPAFAETATTATTADPATAMTDPMTVTCADMMKMDMKGMMDAGVAIKGAMKDDATVTAMTDEDATKAAEEACTAHPDGTVMDAMKAPKM